MVYVGYSPYFFVFFFHSFLGHSFDKLSMFTIYRCIHEGGLQVARAGTRTRKYPGEAFPMDEHPTGTQEARGSRVIGEK